MGKNKRDGDVIYDNFDQYTGQPFNTKVLTELPDGTVITDALVDNAVIFKNKPEHGGGYSVRSEYLEVGKLFLEKDTMQEMRDLSLTEILLLQIGYYRGVTLNGYYSKNDTPSPIQYYLSDTVEEDDGGSVIDVGGIKLEHRFEQTIDIRYFGMMDGTSDDTDKLNLISSLVGEINGGKMVIPKTVNPFMIYARAPIGGGVRDRGFIPKSNSEYFFEPGARFKIIVSTSSAYCGMSVYNIQNTSFHNCWIIGERDEHVGEEGQHGHCIEIYESKNITFSNLRCDKAFGDGVYMGATDGISDNQINSNITFLGKTIFDNCRRQGMSVISAKDSYIEHLYAQDIQGHQPMAAIDFEPNFNWHSIDNFYVNQITAIRCHRAAQFSSRSNYYNLTINNVDVTDCDLPLTFEGLEQSLVRELPSSITINNWNVNKLDNTPPIRMYDWYPDHNGYIVINNMKISEWIVESTQSSSTFVNLLHTRVSENERINMGGITVHNFSIAKHSIGSGVPLRPFFLSLNNSTVDPLIRVSNIKLNLPEIEGVTYDDGHTLIPIIPEKVTITKTQSALVNIYRSTSTSLTLYDNDYLYHSNTTLNLTINRRGFREAVLVNSSSEIKTLNMIGGSSSGISTFVGGGGIIQNGNQFTINPNSVVKITRLSDSECQILLLNIGTRDATQFVKGIVNQSTSVSDVTPPTVTTIEEANTAIQALVTAFNAKLQADRDSGQQAT